MSYGGFHLFVATGRNKPDLHDIGPALTRELVEGSRFLGCVMLLPHLDEINDKLGYEARGSLLREARRRGVGSKEELLTQAIGEPVEQINGFVYRISPEVAFDAETPSYFNAATPETTAGAMRLAEEVIAVHGTEGAQALYHALGKLLEQ